MSEKSTKSGSELFIVDNSDEDWKVLQYLRDWCELSKSLDIATGSFEIRSLLVLDGDWQKIDQIRILMGDEVSRRTKKAFAEGLAQVADRLDESIEKEKELNDFLVGVPAIVDAIRSGKINCRVYRKQKFHAKTYITHARQAVIGSFGLVGSSNFTYPGLTENVELNVQITGHQVGALQEWYEEHWNQAKDVTPEILNTIERHTREYLPFEVYAKSLQEFFRGHEITVSEWELAGPENGGSRMYPVLDEYQKQGYQTMMKIAKKHGGAFLCDGVGLGKTYIGLMILERLIIHERKRVALFVPKAIRKDVWERDLNRYLRYLGGVGRNIYSNLSIFNHTDLGRGGDFPDDFNRVMEMADAIVIDEAHHFRNPGVKGPKSGKPSRYWQLFDLIDGSHGPKQLYMLTATPINNRLDDFRHMIELFSRRQEDYFRSTVGIHSLRGHFNKMAKQLEKAVDIAENNRPTETNYGEAQKVLISDDLFQALVVQRSRAYVKRSQILSGSPITSFPIRDDPKVANYSIKKTYGQLLNMIEEAFHKDNPLFVLGIYYPLAYYRGPDETIDPMDEGRQSQVVSLIRTQFLKRFESSAFAFMRSCDRMLLKLLAWVTKHSSTESEKQRLDRWRWQHSDLIEYIEKRQIELWGEPEDEEADEDIITDEMLEAVVELGREEYKVEKILAETLLDLDKIARFLYELRDFEPKHDDKLRALIHLLKTDPVMKKEKVLIFTEFAETARYLKRELIKANISGVEQIDSGIKKDRSEILRRFSPYYNNSSSAELAEQGINEIRILISTDVLSEGLNLQDATRLINYDLHWNPVRLMQRIGRVDRRMDPIIEEKIIADHPEQKDLRGKIVYWNFLPPEELETLLRLYTRVSNKTLAISKTFGIEGKKLLTPEDDYEALKNFNQEYEGTTTPVEEMHLEFQRFLRDNPELLNKLDNLPGRVFSGKEHPTKDAQGVFFCYRIPLPDHSKPDAEGGFEWTEDAGETKWYLYDLTDEKILEEPSEVVSLIRAEPDTPRRCLIEQKSLREIRLKVEKHIKNTYLKRVQAPIGVKPVLKAWMELN